MFAARTRHWTPRAHMSSIQYVDAGWRGPVLLPQRLLQVRTIPQSNSKYGLHLFSVYLSRLGGAVVRSRTSDSEVTGSSRLSVFGTVQWRNAFTFSFRVRFRVRNRVRVMVRLFAPFALCHLHCAEYRKPFKSHQDCFRVITLRASIFVRGAQANSAFIALG